MIILLLLILDGYSAHIILKIVNLHRSNHIVCLMLPAHTTHALQPVDIVLFNSVKDDWARIAKNHFKEGNKKIRNSDFPRLMKKLFVNKAAFSSTRIVSSFSKAGEKEIVSFLSTYLIFIGIWPFDKEAMCDKVSRNSINSGSSILEDSVLAPTNRLGPPANNFGSSFPSSLGSSASSSSTANQLMDTNTKSLLTSTINNSSCDSHNRTTAISCSSLSPSIVLDHQDVLPPFDDCSYGDLQSCPFDVTCELDRSTMPQTSAPQPEMIKNVESISIDTDETHF